MGDGDDPDLYGRGAAPSRAGAARWVARIVGVLAGGAISLYGVAQYALRCFSTCPADPSVDKTIQLLSAALVLFGLVVAVAAASIGTRWAAGAAVVVAALGVVIAACGVVTLALAPSIDSPGGAAADTAVAGGAALFVGAAVTAGALFRRRSASRHRD